MPGASATTLRILPRPVFPARVKTRTTLNVPHIALLNRTDCVVNLMTKGYQDFQLANGALGRFVFQEYYEHGKFEGFYVGFALKNVASKGYTIYGRMLFGQQELGQKNVLLDGYGLLKKSRPEGECAELARDGSTPVFVAKGIRTKYSRIGQSLMNLVICLAADKGVSEIRVSQSLSRQSDKFYGQTMGFQKVREGQFVYRLGRRDAETQQIIAISPKSNEVSANWRPAEKELDAWDKTEVDFGDQPSWSSRVLRSCLAFLRPARVEA